MHLRETRDVAPGPRETFNVATPDRVTVNGEHDGDVARRALGGTRFRCRGRKDHVHAEADKLGREARQTVELPIRKAILDVEILALDPAQIAQPLLECTGPLCGSSDAPQKADRGDFLLRLCFDGERRHKDTAR